MDSLDKHHIKVSTDGRGLCKDNIWIERFWCTINNKYIYFHLFDDGKKLREGIRWYMSYYNNRRFHQGIRHDYKSSKISSYYIFLLK
ncbi:MAG: integrase core domain-containing protein [Paludibacteraceae bacterium]|nr:integrase core domain-containing protein [Paludibacteraceae bacterium]